MFKKFKNNNKISGATTTPSNQLPSKDPLETAIVGGINDIFTNLELDKKLNEITTAITSGFSDHTTTVKLLIEDLSTSINDKILALVNAIYGCVQTNETPQTYKKHGKHSKNYNDTQNAVTSGSSDLTTNINLLTAINLLTGINDKMLAIVGVLYGYRQINKTTQSTSLLNKIGKIKLNDTIIGGITEYLDNINDLIKASIKANDAVAKNAVTNTPQNITNKATTNNITNKNIKIENLGDALNGIASFLSSINPKNIKEMKNKLSFLISLTSETSNTGIFALYNNIYTICEEIKSNKSNISELKKISNGVTALSNINKSITFKSIIELNSKLLMLNIAIYNINKFINLINTIQPDKILGKVNNITKIIKEFGKKLDVKQLDILSDFIIKLSSVYSVLAKSAILSPFAIIGAGATVLLLKLLTLGIKSLNTIKIKDSDINKLKNLENLSIALQGISVSLAIAGVLAIPAIIGAGAILIEFTILALVVKSINKFNKIKIKDSVIDKLELVANLVVGASLIMIIGSLAAKVIDFRDLLEFTGEFLIFMLAISGIIVVISKATQNINKTIKNVNNIILLISACAGILIIGALVNKIPGLFISAMKFAIELGVFILAIAAAYNLANRIIKDDKTIKEAQLLSKLIAISATTLILGGLFMLIPGMWLATLGFAVILGVFILGVVAAYNRATRILKDDETIEEARLLSKLIAISANTLILGGLFMLIPGMWLATLGFAVILGVFILGVVMAYNFANHIIKNDKTIKEAELLSKLIAISSATLLIGGLFMLIPGMWLATLGFAVILGVFIAVIVAAFAIANKHISNAYKTAIGLSLLIAITGATLLIAGYIILNNPGITEAIFTFIGASVVMIAAMGVAVWLLGKINKATLIKGGLALVGIVGIIWLLGKAFKTLTETIALMNSVDNIRENLGIMGTVLLSIGALVTILAGIIGATGGAGALAIAGGVAAVAAFVGIIWEIGKAFSAIAQSISDLEKIKNFKSEEIINSLEEYMKIFPYITKFSNLKTLYKIKVAASVCNSISNVIYQIAKSVKGMADLSTILYDENGKEIGRRKLDESDFSKASTNIAEIISVLGGTIIDVYNNNPEIFNAGNSIANLLGMETPFSRVANSCKTLGKMINDIAKGVKTYSKLPEGLDFDTISTNIQTVISCLGGAILSLYNSTIDVDGYSVSAKEMFSWELIGDNPFVRVVKSCSTLGKMINDIAKGVKTYSKLPEGLDFNAISTNIQIVISCLGGAILETYNNPKFRNMFGWTLIGDNPFATVVKSLSGVGDIISTATDGIKKVNELNLPANFNESNSPLQTKIQGIISCIAKGIMDAYDSNPEWFTDDSFWHNNAKHTPFGMVKACLSGTSKIIEDAAKGIKKVLELNITDITALNELISTIISLIPSSIMSVALDPRYKKYFEDEDGKLFTNISNGFKKFTSLLNEVAKAYKSIYELEFTIEDGKQNSVSSLSAIFAKMISDLPYQIIKEYNKHPDYYSNNGIKEIKNIKKAFDTYKDIIDTLIGTYDNIFKFINKNNMLNNTSAIDSVNVSVESMLNGISRILSINTSELISTEAVTAFSEKVKIYVDSIISISEVYNKVPSDSKKYDGLANAIQNMNSEIAKIPNQSLFAEETENASKLVKTINSINITRVDKLTNLVNSLNSLGSKFNNLDKFTTVLADKISTVLTKLADSINNSATIITNADKIQSDRKKHIDSLLNEVREVLNTGLDITIMDGSTNTDNNTYNKPNTDLGTYVDYHDNTPTTATSSNIDYNKLEQTIRRAILTKNKGTGNS